MPNSSSMVQTTMSSSEGHVQAVEAPTRTQTSVLDITPIADDDMPNNSSMERTTSSNVADGDISDADTTASNAHEPPAAADAEVTRADIEAHQATRQNSAVPDGEITSHPLSHITITSSMGSSPPGSPAHVGVPSKTSSDNGEEQREKRNGSCNGSC
jgi:hypothetical protein